MGEKLLILSRNGFLLTITFSVIAGFFLFEKELSEKLLASKRITLVLYPIDVNTDFLDNMTCMASVR